MNKEIFQLPLNFSAFLSVRNLTCFKRNNSLAKGTNIFPKQHKAFSKSTSYFQRAQTFSKSTNYLSKGTKFSQRAGSLFLKAQRTWRHSKVKKIVTRLLDSIFTLLLFVETSFPRVLYCKTRIMNSHRYPNLDVNGLLFNSKDYFKHIEKQMFSFYNEIQ